MTAINLNKRAAKAAEQSQAIEAIYDQLRNGTITLANGWRFQADRDSVITMQETVENWSIPTQTRDSEGRQLWMDADNNLRAFTEADFVAFVSEIRAKRAAIVDATFAYKTYKKSLLPLPDDDAVFTASNWPGQ